MKGIDGARWPLQVDVPTSRAASRELVELQLPGEKVAGEGKAAMVALMTALPFGVAAGWMLLVAKSSQRRGTLLPTVGIATTCLSTNTEKHLGESLGMVCNTGSASLSPASPCSE